MKRISIEIDEDLLARAKLVLGETTTRGAVEAALRRATESADVARAHRASRQRRYLDQLLTWVDVDVLASKEMWRQTPRLG